MILLFFSLFARNNHNTAEKYNSFRFRIAEKNYKFTIVFEVMEVGPLFYFFIFIMHTSFKTKCKTRLLYYL